MKSRNALLAAVAAVGMTCLIPANASGAADTSPPTVRIDGRAHVRVGSTFIDDAYYAYSDPFFPGITNMSIKWKQSDPSGICGNSSKVLLTNDFNDRSTVASSGTIRTSLTFTGTPRDVEDRAYGQSYVASVTATDCAGNSGRVEGMLVLPVLHQEGDFTFSPGWTSGSCKCWSGGAVMKSSSAGQTATYTGEFAEFALVTNTAVNRGGPRCTSTASRSEPSTTRWPAHRKDRAEGSASAPSWLTGHTR